MFLFLFQFQNPDSVLCRQCVGSLLEYLRKNKDNIGSRDLLTWASQIAQGMAYLEVRVTVLL